MPGLNCPDIVPHHLVIFCALHSRAPSTLPTRCHPPFPLGAAWMPTAPQPVPSATPATGWQWHPSTSLAAWPGQHSQWAPWSSYCACGASTRSLHRPAGMLCMLLGS